ncbi:MULTISPECIES: DUF1259 domain-containing protein [unclassified Paenibacillus]|uniref:DUF1259 domain-containing protein n=1 Tax=unclassified Paenibacillus TaxID=185978 RepID=UPI002404BABD|nr:MULTISPECIES: DUF1259 domain-containing protein [unclassified Paenibacillus]MDF9839531.1 hypothetical protein [Paenibacillus sp. PastF-2]MDF9846112.1 hypothetical protein [Paenibacillus sp. PastM-2]MDF9852684.1 hypothetical protein [Paenibacillus sp. PastF-1]MDH6477585.1 hypothetical protein [Paenibacillus sp. PastH-2]
MHDISGLCHQFAQILGGEHKVEQGVCMVNRGRNHHNRVSILGRPSQSGLTLHSMWSFESIDSEGKTLNLGETALFQEEVFPFTWHLQRNGILLSALHNHWLMDNPHLIYAHYASVEDPLSFARKVAEAYKLLK